MMSEHNEDEATRNEGRRFVLLVTTPVGESFQSIAKATGFKALQRPSVDWESCQKSALPDLESRLRFTTHYALCVVNCEIWEDTSLTLLEKFRKARFWDHPGDATIMAPSRSSRSNSSVAPASMNAGMPWPEQDIRSIDSGQVIGLTAMSDEEITRDYTELRRDWIYMPVYWNCHDLAIRLAYIVVQPSIDVINVLKGLMKSLRQAYHTEINWDSTAGKVALGGWGAGALGSLVSVPPLAVAGAGIFMVGWSIGFFGSFAVGLKMQKRYRFMIKLEEKFPQLKSLHN